ncbi:MAG: electron transfer flavoprotein subunit alpha/FixB family protein [Ardenticatenia bacterium]|nr:electron transfer flavoprotein subunit alpha/FixB family protein [Ardenticatenia bacterium]
MMQTVWVIAETRDGALKKVSLELISAARSLGSGTVVAVVLGHGLSEPATALAAGGADRVLVMDDARLATYAPDGWAAALADLAAARRPDVILGAATSRGRDLLPRVAARLGVGLASDAIEVGVDDGHLTALRPIYAGKALAHVAISGRPAMATLRPNSYPVAAGGGDGQLEAVSLGDYHSTVTAGGIETARGARPDVAEADVIVSGGRGMGGPEHFAMLEELADELHAAVGASRAVVDAGWRPHGDQVGQTGKTVSPSLYVACGISGAVQHLAGMKTSKVIVAINKDPEAPIFSVADYGIVGDVFEVVPALIAAVRALSQG